MSLRRETLPFVLVTASKVLSVVATSVITFCFVFPSLMFKSKKKILLQVKIILQNSQKMAENVKCSLSFLSVNKILFLSSKTVLKSTRHWLFLCFYVLLDYHLMLTVRTAEASPSLSAYILSSPAVSPSFTATPILPARIFLVAAKSEPWSVISEPVE